MPAVEQRQDRESEKIIFSKSLSYLMGIEQQFLADVFCDPVF